MCVNILAKVSLPVSLLSVCENVCVCVCLLETDTGGEREREIVVSCTAGKGCTCWQHGVLCRCKWMCCMRGEGKLWQIKHWSF